MKIRRRTLAKIGLFLLAGAAVNLGVAWSIALFAPVGPRQTSDWRWSVTRTSAALWPTPIPPTFRPPSSTDPVRDITVVADGVGMTRLTAMAGRLTERDDLVVGDHWSALRVDAGVPFRGVTGRMFIHQRTEHTQPPEPPEGTVFAGAPLPEPTGYELIHVGAIRLADLGRYEFGAAPHIALRLIPHHPKPAGFLANTAFYAALLFITARAVSRTLRLPRAVPPGRDT